MREPRFPDRTTLTVALVVAAMPFLLPSVTLASEILVFATAALSCTLLLGSAGLLSFGQGLFFGIGAYLSGILLRDFGFGTLAAVLCAVTVAAAIAAVLGWLAVRRRGVYFVMVTLAFAQMGYFAMLALRDTTGGENGLTGVPRPPLLAGLGPLTSPWSVYALLAALCLAAFTLSQRMITSPFGSVLVAIRENEGRAEALGYDVRRFKVAIFAASGGVAGLAGAMYVLFLGFVPPSSIDLELSERLVIMSILGGTGAPAGALLGAGCYALMSELFSPLWPRWLILVALLLIVIVHFLRGGLWGGLVSLGTRWRRKAADA
jgi:branched-chain amino acid transport system permease protein